MCLQSHRVDLASASVFASCQLFSGAVLQNALLWRSSKDQTGRFKENRLLNSLDTLDSCHSVFSLTWRYYVHLTWRYHVQTRGLAESSRCEAPACHLKIQKSTVLGLTCTSFSNSLCARSTAEQDWNGDYVFISVCMSLALFHLIAQILEQLTGNLVISLYLWPFFASLLAPSCLFLVHVRTFSRTHYASS